MNNNTHVGPPAGCWCAKDDLPTDPGFLPLGYTNGPVPFVNSFSPTRMRIPGSRNTSGWVPQVGVQGAWLLIWYVVDQQLPCFAHAARRRQFRPKPSDPISDTTLDPDSCWRFCLHNSTLRNRIQNWISKSDPKLDPSSSVLGRKFGRQIGHPMGHFGPVHSWVHNRHPAGPGRHLVNKYYYSVLATRWFSGALVCFQCFPNSYRYVQLVLRVGRAS